MSTPTSGPFLDSAGQAKIPYLTSRSGHYELGTPATDFMDALATLETALMSASPTPLTALISDAEAGGCQCSHAMIEELIGSFSMAMLA